MTDPTIEETTTAAPATDDTTDPSGKRGASREAAKYRRAARDAEAERDALAGRVAALQRAEVERLADVAGIKPAALWATGVDLPDVLTADGAVDTQAVAERLEAATADLGLQRRVDGNVAAEGRYPDLAKLRGIGNSFEDAFKPDRGR
jgi:hypothetical protein